MTDTSHPGKPTLLIVDDTPANLRVLVDSLEEQGFWVLVALNGEEAIDRAVLAQPDLILLDVVMPGIDGYETCRRLKAAPSTRGIPIIFMTVRSDEEDKLAGFAAGGVDYVTKPVQFAELLARVRTHLALWAAEAALEAQCRKLQQEIAERQLLDSRLQFLATHDMLTGLPNRALLLDRLAQTIANAQRSRKQFIVGFLDLDCFKWVNDRFGHQTGDAVLSNIAGRMVDCLRATDTIARLGGDEFVLLLVDLDDVRQGLDTLQRVMAAIVRPIPLEEGETVVTCSIGCSTFPDDGMSPEVLLGAADAAMYRAKETGRNNLQLYNAALRQRVDERHRLAGELRFAIQREQFALEYQPRIELLSGTVVGIEALLRWQHPEFGNVAAERFAPLAEEFGLLLPISEWMLEHACAQNVAWQQAGLPRVRVIVNLPLGQLACRDVPSLVSQVLTSTGLAPADLELTLTESEAMGDPEHMLPVMARLKWMGLFLALDLSGTSFSNMKFLPHFPLNWLKLDGGLVHDLTSDPGCLAITEALIVMAHRLGLQVVVPGIEGEGQLKLLTERECDLGQGGYFCQPMAADACATLLAAGPVTLPEGLLRLSSRPTLLVLDDDPFVTQLVVLELRDAPYQVLTTNDPGEAFELLACQPVGVVLADQSMPSLTGAEFLGRVRQLYPDTIRLLFSSYHNFEMATEALNREAAHRFLSKPLDPELFRQVLGESFAQYAHALASKGGRAARSR